MKHEQVPTARVRGALPPLQAKTTEQPDGFVRPLYTLYTPGQVALATFLGSPLAGSWLISRNFKRLDKPGLGWLMVVMGIVWTAGLCTLGVLEKSPGILSILSIPAMTLVMRGVQGRALDDHASRGGAQTSWGYVVLAGVSCLAIVFTAVFGIAIAYALAVTPPSVPAPNGAEVRYTDGATEADAIRVRDALAELGYFTGAITVQVQRDNNRWLVGYVVNDGALRDHKTVVEFGDLSDTLSAKAFHGEPVDTVLMNDLGELTKSRTEFEHRMRTLAFGKDEILFRDFSDDQIKAIAGVFTAQGYFGGEFPQSAKVERGIRIEVELGFPEAKESPRTALQGMVYHHWCRELSKALADQPVDLKLGDLDGAVYASYRWPDLLPAPVFTSDVTMVFYRDGATRKQAETVASVLDRTGASDPFGAFVLTLDDNYQPPRLVVGVIPMEDIDVASATVQATLRALAEPVSKELDGVPIDVRILDDELNMTQLMSWEDRPKRTGAIRPKR